MRAMSDNGARAVFVGEDGDTASVCKGAYQIVYLSPEALLENEQWRDMLLNSVYAKCLIDEAHCVKKW